ncbi:hypothetical protein CDLVIII_5918 [Clostridium sp. DL-VIII]|uniref:hypothetical protein n=1 Tax=Clostridium sp. DL-VIII TaxID=641107 RepID=UPI00023B03D0|nr:hypothetical protein [Clostridium sp. DL-VIII]EHJ02381.1 hypothetical protein CDLVIII_5918 [Clostridium sp. DL-VIII]
MMKTNKIFLGLSTLIVAGLLSTAIQSYAYEKKKITIHPVNELGEQIHNNIETAAMKTDYGVRWNNKWYYIKSDGTMATNTYIGEYYVDANGEWVG